MRGGKRTPRPGKHLGRPKKSQKKVATRDVAAEVLESIDQVKYWRNFLHSGESLDDLSSTDREEVRSTLTYLTNRVHGKPTEKIESEYFATGVIPVVHAHLDLSHASDADLEAVERFVAASQKPAEPRTDKR